jgi:hypothetical protein
VHEISLTPEATSALSSLAGSLGFDAVRIDLAACSDKTSFLGQMAEALAFPNWFGQNWDAFFDCLADLSWRPARGSSAARACDTMRHDAPEALDTRSRSWAMPRPPGSRAACRFRVFVSAPEPTAPAERHGLSGSGCRSPACRR